MKHTIIRLVSLLAGLLVSTAGLAHPGHTDAGGLFAGAVHPLLGVDHILALFVPGLLLLAGLGLVRWLRRLGA